MHTDRIRALALPLSVGGVLVPNRVFLAPMSGVTDRPFRSLAARLGAGLVVSEMVASEQLVRGETESVMRAERAEGTLHVIQLAGREAHWMAEGARAAADAGADIIDINMGCPARKVTNGYSGSALMRDLDHAVRLIEATVGATSVPVTVKMRLGWDDRSRNAAELARRAETAGARLVTVHGRTRCQFYEGRADWDAIRAVKEAVSIPVIANGDLVEAGDLDDLLSRSGADGVMVGRGAYGRPWLPGAIARFAGTGELAGIEDTARKQTDLIVEHYDSVIAWYGDPLGVRMARKHLGWYLDRFLPSTHPTRRAILTEMQPAEVVRLIEACFADLEERRAA